MLEAGWLAIQAHQHSLDPAHFMLGPGHIPTGLWAGLLPHWTVAGPGSGAPWPCWLGPGLVPQASMSAPSLGLLPCHWSQKVAGTHKQVRLGRTQTVFTFNSFICGIYMFIHVVHKQQLRNASFIFLLHLWHDKSGLYKDSLC